MAQLTITGQMLVPDDFGRPRILILDAAPDGRRDGSAWALRSAAFSFGPGTKTPFSFGAKPDGDCAWGPCTLVAPARHRRHWLAEAARLRGQFVAIVVAPRRYRMPVASGAAHSGFSLDIVSIDLAAAPTALPAETLAHSTVEVQPE